VYKIVLLCSLLLFFFFFFLKKKYISFSVKAEADAYPSDLNLLFFFLIVTRNNSFHGMFVLNFVCFKSVQ
jgi:hypothetical protein